MTSDLLESVSRGEDRDYAPFFAGRESEIGKFEEAVDRSRVVRQTQFRIFQGAPGCGKTSLLTHLRANAPDNRVFVAVDPEHLTSRQALMGRIDAKLHDAPSPIAKGVAAFVRHTSRLAGMYLSAPGAKAAGEAAGSAIESGGEMLDERKRASVREQSELVLLLDEAQCLDKNHEGVLRSLHTDGLEDLHTVFAFAGLSHTGSTMRGLHGLSRLSRTADVNMGLLSKEECEDSTRQMLDRCGIEGDPVRREDVVRQVAAMSQLWPQHLACAHAALASELIRVERDIGRIDLNVVEQETTDARHEYYRGRLQGHPVLENTRFTASIAAAVRVQNAAAAKEPPEAEPVSREGQIARLCRQAMEAEPEDSDVREYDIRPADIVRTMIEKGIFSQIPGEPYEVTIPSMATWLDEHLATCGHHGRTRHGGRD